MRSVKKTIKSPKTKAALHQLERSGARELKATSSKKAVEPKSKNERKSKNGTAARSRTQAAKRDAAKTNSNRIVSTGRVIPSDKSAAPSRTAALKSAGARKTSPAREGKAGSVANKAAVANGAARTLPAAKGAEKKTVKTATHATRSAVKSMQPKPAAAPSKARRPKVQIRAKAPAPAVAARQNSNPASPACERKATTETIGAAIALPASKVVALLRAAKRQSMDPATTPELAMISLNPTPGTEQTTVTKKIEKKTSVGSTPTNDSATPVILEPAAKTVAMGKPAKTPAAKAAVALATPAEAAQSVNVEAALSVETAHSQAMEPPKTVEKTIAPASKTGRGSSAARQGFKPNEFIVYPAHGVGQIVAIEEQEVAGFKLELFVISFVKDKMILKVPTPKVVSVGMRKLAEADVVKKALDTLTGRARVKRTMWSRRAQEYEAKINSGDLIAIAEVVRDLYRSDAQPEQSYSERQLYEAALDRMAREIVVVQKLTETESLKAIEAQLQKGPRRGKTEDVDTDEADIEEAA